MTSNGTNCMSDYAPLQPLASSLLRSSNCGLVH